MAKPTTVQVELPHDQPFYILHDLEGVMVGVSECRDFPGHAALTLGYNEKTVYLTPQRATLLASALLKIAQGGDH